MNYFKYILTIILHFSNPKWPCSHWSASNYFWDLREKKKSNHFTVKIQYYCQVPGLVQDILYLTAVFNTCINPLIYGVYYYSERASQASRAVSSRNNLASFRSQSNISHLSITPQTTKSALKGRRETLTTSRPDPKSAHYMSRKFSASPRCQMKISDEEFELVKIN